MKKAATIVVVILALFAGLVWAVWWSIGSCRPLDRLLGLSGCTDVVVIADFSPLTRTTMSPVDEDGFASLFGQVLTADGYQPALIRLDPVTGREVGRYPLPIQNAFSHLVISADERRAAINCMSAFDCIENDDAFAVVDVTTGRLIETLPRQSSTYPKVFPGEAEPCADCRYEALFADGAQRIVREDDAHNLVLQDLEGKVIATLMADFGSRDRWLSISPTSRHIGLLQSYADRVVITVWNAHDGAPVASFTADGRGWSGIAWAHDERAVFALLQRDGGEHLARFALPAKASRS